MTGGLVIVKLYAADALVKEPPLLLQAGQRLRYMLLPGQCVLPQEGIGNMLCVNKQHIMLMLVMLPMWMNFLLRTYAWMGLLSINGPVNAVLGVFGLGPYNMLNTSGAVVLGMVYNYVPYMILPLYTSMTKIDQSIVEAAQDLGASTTKTLFRVLIPMSIPGISTGITMVFVPAVSTFVISRMLGGGSNLLIGDLIEMQFLGNSYNLNVGSAMSLVLMVIVLLCMSFTSSFDEDEMEGVS